MSCGCGSCLFLEYGGGASGVDSTELDHEPYAPAPPAPAEPKPPLCRTCLMHHRAGENTLCSRFDPEPAPPAPAEHVADYDCVVAEWPLAAPAAGGGR